MLLTGPPAGPQALKTDGALAFELRPPIDFGQHFGFNPEPPQVAAASEWDPKRKASRRGICCGYLLHSLTILQLRLLHPEYHAATRLCILVH